MRRENARANVSRALIVLAVAALLAGLLLGGWEIVLRNAQLL